MTAYGQATYAYDASGNRTTREIILDTTTPQSTQSPRKAKASLSEIFSETSISFFPNPTEGILNVTISTENDLEGSACILSTAGSIIDSRTLEHEMIFNFEDNPSGVYFLKVAIGEETRTYKIIKK